MLPLRELTVGQALSEAAKKYGPNPAIEYEKTTWSYEELDVFTDSLAKGFMSLGIRRGTHVALWANIEPNVLLVFYALQKIGAVTVMLYYNQTLDIVEEQLRRTQCDYLIIGKKLLQDDTEDFCSRLEQQNICRVITLGIGRCGTFMNCSDIWGKSRLISNVRLQQEKDKVLPQDPSVILFTSGTSGRTKAVVISHYSRVNGGIQQADDLGATEKDVFCVVLPMYHCFCLNTNVFAALAVGGKLCIQINKRTQTVLNAIQEKKCTILNAVPTFYHALCCREDLKEYDISSLRVGLIGGGTYSPEQFQKFEETLGITLLSSLGLTEATAGVTVCNIDDPMEIRRSTVGHFMSHVEGKIIDVETGKELPTGSQGEICVRGYVVMKGYYGDPELTAQVIDSEGWLHTGDIGWLDETGYLHLCGRLKDLVIRAGENISPLEVGNMISNHPMVKDIKVIGVPDEHYGEELCACIVQEPGAKLTEDEVRAFAASCLVSYKVPRYVLFFDALPYNATGKIVTGRLKEMVAETGKIKSMKAMLHI